MGGLANFLRIAGTKALPVLGKLGSGSPWVLRGAGAVGGALPGVMRGDLGAAVVGGGMGAASTLGMGGAASRLMPGAANVAARAVGNTGLGATVAGLTGRAAVPVVGGLVSGRVLGAGFPGPQVAQGVQNVAGGAGGAAALNMQNQPNVTGGYIGSGGPVPNLTGAHGQMVQGPDGNIYQQIDPTGYRQGGRFGSGLDTMQDISNANRWFQSRFPQREMIMKADFERELAAAQLKRNMDLAKEITAGYASSSRNIAEDANRNMGTLLATQNKYF